MKRISMVLGRMVLTFLLVSAFAITVYAADDDKDMHVFLTLIVQRHDGGFIPGARVYVRDVDNNLIMPIKC